MQYSPLAPSRLVSPVSTQNFFRSPAATVQSPAGWVDTYDEAPAPLGLVTSFRPQPPAVQSRAPMRMRDLSQLRPEVEVVYAGDPACGRVVALGQNHGGPMKAVSQLAMLRELVAMKPRHIFVEGTLVDGDAALIDGARQRVLEALREAGDDPVAQGRAMLKRLGEEGAGAIYAACVDPRVKLHAADVPREVRVRARDRGGNKALADVTFNVRESKVFRDVAATLRAEPGSTVAIIYGYGHDFRRIGDQFLGHDGFDPNFIWKNTSGAPMSEVRAIRQDALRFLAGTAQPKVGYKLELDEAHPPWLDAFLQGFIRDIEAGELAA